MSQLNVGTIQTTTITPTNGVSVNFGGSAVPTYAGSPMVSQGNLSATPVGDAGGYFANDNLGAQLQEIAAAFQTLTPGTTGSMAAIIKQFYRIANPVGKVAMGYWTTAPAGTLPLIGGVFSRAAYPELWAFANSSGLVLSEAAWSATGGNTFFSSGNGADTFRLPDLRAESPRFWDNGRGIDVGRVLGSWQEDSFKSHYHLIYGQDNSAAPTGNTALELGNIEPPGSGAAYFSRQTSSEGGTETRPRNVALAAVIYY